MKVFLAILLVVLVVACSRSETSSENPKKAQTAQSAEVGKPDMATQVKRAIARGDVVKLERMLEQGYCAKDCSSEIALALEKSRNKKEVIGVILRYASEIHSVETGYYKTIRNPIEFAIKKHEYEIAGLLLQKTELKDSGGDYYHAYLGPIHDEDYPDDATMQLLSKLFLYGLRSKDEHGNLVGAAVANDKIRTLNFLIKSGFPMSKRVIHSYAISSNDPNILDVLIKNGADINARDKDGLTPLENRLSLSPPPSAALVAQLKNAGATVDEKKIEEKKAEYYRIDKERCEEINAKWWRAFAKASRGEKLLPGEDVALPGYCKKYLD